MKNTFEKNMNKATMSQESILCERIVNLYNQMICTNAGAEDYRTKLVYELLQLQKEDGSFRVIDNNRCDSDIRVAYIYYPTYYATAALVYAATFDGINETMKNALKKGLTVACERHLSGHGFEATKQQLEALSIYKKANLYEFLQLRRDDYSEFYNTIKDIIDNYRTRLSQNRTVSDWSVDYRKQFETEVSDYDLNMVKNVWYASYGSNICLERFMEYINRCTDKTAPTDVMPITFNHNIYFSGESRTWERKGTAFLDDSCSGMALGRMYLITSEQFAQIQYYEGAKYSKKLQLGSKDGYPIYTFTAPSKRSDKKTPSAQYFNTILAGLKDTYPEISETTLVTYLLESGLVDDDDCRILSFIRNSEHGVSLQTISNNTISLSKTKKSIRKLVELGLLKQDRRSLASGHQVTDNEAVFFTKKERREAIILLLLMNR